MTPGEYQKFCKRTAKKFGNRKGIRKVFPRKRPKKKSAVLFSKRALLYS